MIDFTAFDPAPAPEPKPDLCKCSTCQTTFKVADCATDHDHHDGLEMPAYTEILCSVCDDGGCIDDFWFSGRIQIVYLVRIKKLSQQVMDQWYQGKLKAGQIRKVIEVYRDGKITARGTWDRGFMPIPESHYTILREL